MSPPATPEEAAATIARLNRRAQAAESAYRAMRVLVRLEGKGRRHWTAYAEVVGKYERARVAGYIGNAIIGLVRDLADALPDDRRTYRALRAAAAKVAAADRFGDWTAEWAQQYVAERDALYATIAGMVRVIDELRQRRGRGLTPGELDALLSNVDGDFLASLERAGGVGQAPDPCPACGGGGLVDRVIEGRNALGSYRVMVPGHCSTCHGGGTVPR